MLVLDVVADDDVLALADGEIVEVGARIELDLVADDAALPWPAGAEAAVTVSTAPLSTSVSLASTSIRTTCVLAGRAGVGIGGRRVVEAGDVEDQRAGVAAVVVRDGVVEAVGDVLALGERLGRGVQGVAVGAVGIERQRAVGADEGAAGHGERVAVEIEIVVQHARRAAAVGAGILVDEDMVVAGDRRVVAAADVDDAVGEDQPLDADQLVVAVGAGAAEMEDVQIAGGGEEGIFADRCRNNRRCRSRCRRRSGRRRRRRSDGRRRCRRRVSLPAPPNRVSTPLPPR